MPRNGLWTVLVTEDELSRAVTRPDDSSDLLVRLQITRSHGGGARSRVCAVRIIGAQDPEAHEQSDRRRVAISALDGLSLAIECAHQHQADRDIVQACRLFLQMYAGGDPERESFIRECGGGNYL